MGCLSSFKIQDLTVHRLFFSITLLRKSQILNLMFLKIFYRLHTISLINSFGFPSYYEWKSQIITRNREDVKP